MRANGHLGKVKMVLYCFFYQKTQTSFEIWVNVLSNCTENSSQVYKFIFPSILAKFAVFSGFFMD